MNNFNEIIVELSFNCNLDCIMCGFGKKENPFDKRKFLSLERYTQILQQIGDKTKAIRLNGRGESTLHPDFVHILNYTKNAFPKITVNLFSSFSFKNNAIIESFIKNDVQLFISLDSPVATELESIRKGANFQFIKSNIERLPNLPKRPFIVFTIQESNLHRIYEIAKFAKDNKCNILYNTVRRDKGIDSFVSEVKNNLQEISTQFQNVTDLFQGTPLQCLIPDQLSGVKLRIEKSQQTCGTSLCCPCLEKELCILYDGIVTPCNMFNPYKYGNIFNQTLAEIWKGNKRNDFLKLYKNCYYCKNCANLGV